MRYSLIARIGALALALFGSACATTSQQPSASASPAGMYEVRSGSFEAAWVPTIRGWRKLHYQSSGGTAYFEGDIILGPSQSVQRRSVAYEKMNSSLQSKEVAYSTRVASGASSFFISPAVRHAPPPLEHGYYIDDNQSRWPNDVVPYCISPELIGVESDIVSRIQSAIDDYQSNTRIRFEQVHDCEGNWQTTHPLQQTNYFVVFLPSDVCNSYVGMLYGPDSFKSGQPINLSPNCDGGGGIIHELGHALGLFHEQERPDRDKFIRINVQNIVDGYASQFDLDPSIRATTGGVPYDCHSVMHYPPWAFAKPGTVTISPLVADCTDIGTATKLSPIDVDTVNQMYPK